MSEENSQPNNPFEFLFQDLMNTLGRQNVSSEDLISQFAILPVSDPEYCTNVNPLDRLRIERLFELAQHQIANIDFLPGSSRASGIKLQLENPRSFVEFITKQWGPYISTISDTLAITSITPVGDESLDSSNPLGSVLSQLGSAISPMLSGAQIGSLLGHYGKDAMRAYEVPIPLQERSSVALVTSNISNFVDQWSLDLDQFTLWTLVQELTMVSILDIEAFRDRLDLQIRLHLADMRADVSKVMGKLRDINPSDPQSIQALLSDPTELAGSEMTEAQKINYDNIEVSLVIMEAMTNLVCRKVANSLFGEHYLIEEASRRRKLNAPQASVLLGRMFGIDITSRVAELGNTMADFVAESGSHEVLSAALEDTGKLPYQAELENLSAWISRASE